MVGDDDSGPPEFIKGKAASRAMTATEGATYFFFIVFSFNLCVFGKLFNDHFLSIDNVNASMQITERGRMEANTGKGVNHEGLRTGG